eukprot:3343237-Prymnesium_polylepis.1
MHVWKQSAAVTYVSLYARKQNMFLMLDASRICTPWLAIHGALRWSGCMARWHTLRSSLDVSRRSAAQAFRTKTVFKMTPVGSNN